MPTDDDMQLSAREQLLVEKVVTMAEDRLIASFYREVGKAVVNRFLIVLGAVAVAFAFGKGWISPGSLK